ncbi:MAG: hypothetical protein M1834_004229 [Cirrosporium novae-zelandiae]|nr:MAG: hypothetical protein M1834_004229 [Cirrosporium novae-zelandiae]
MSYIIKLTVFNDSDETLTVVEKTCFTTGIAWTEDETGHFLFMDGSGTSGMLRYKSSSGEIFCLALGIHNYKRWCDIVTDLKEDDTAKNINPAYYGGLKSDIIWTQHSTFATTTKRGSKLKIDYSTNEGRELVAEFTYRGQYSDVGIQRIANQLRETGKESWGHVPRIYIVLRAIDKLEYMQMFVDNGITDLWFPFSKQSIPTRMAPGVYMQFLNTQWIVCTGATNLEEGEHCHLTETNLDYDSDAPKQLQWKAYLGSGGFGYVQKVLGLKEYALKQINRKNTFSETLEVMKYVESELKVFKKMKDRESQYHFIKFIESYTTSTTVGLITSPVAGDNLAGFFTKVPGAIDKKILLLSFFGCLSSAVAYLHYTLNIRHKDIKPQNILVKKNNILITDFGMAWDWADIEQATTKAEMRKSSIYCSPEAASNGSSRSSSDIWSLGCVFLEMITVLKGETIERMRNFFLDKDAESEKYWMIPKAILLWIKELRDRGGSEFENKPLEWINNMLQQDKNKRWNARYLKDSILSFPPDAHSGSASTESGISQGSVQVLHQMALEYMAKLFYENTDLRQLYLEAFKKVDKKVFANNHDSLLKKFFYDLRLETQNKPQQLAIHILRKQYRRGKVTETIYNHLNPSPERLQAMQQLETQKPDSRPILNRYLQSQTSMAGVPEELNIITLNFPIEDSDSNRSSEVEDNESSENNEKNKDFQELESVVAFLTEGASFNHFKDNLRRFIHPPTTIKEALEYREVKVLQRLLAKRFDLVAESEYSWIRELNRMGYSYDEIAELLFEEANDTPRIYFEPSKFRQAQIKSGIHIPGYAHRDCASGTSPTESTEEIDIGKTVQELCDLAGIKPISRDPKEWNGSIIFEEQNSIAILYHIMVK